MTQNRANGQDKASERAFYDGLFKTRRRFDQFHAGIYERIAADLRRSAPGPQALDVGCGSGSQALCLINEGFEVVALDLSIEAVNVTRLVVKEAVGRSKVLNADAESLPLPDKSVDACVCGMLLHHFGDLSPIAAELRRIVRPGGVVMAIDANAHNPFVWLFFNVIHRIRPLKRLTPNQRALTRSEIERAFTGAGFADFRFDSMTSKLRRDWLGDSLGARMNYHTRALVLNLSHLLLPKICHGNMLLSSFRRSDGAEE